jgi:hypothetical protein
MFGFGVREDIRCNMPVRDVVKPLTAKARDFKAARDNETSA